MLKWGELRLRVLRNLDDLDRTRPTWTDDDLVDYANDLLAAASLHTAQEKTHEVTSTVDLDELQLPHDYMDPGPVWLIQSSTRVLLNPVRLQPGQDLPTSSTASGRTGYYEWPKGKLNFLNTVSKDYTVRAHYWGYWDRIENDDSLLYIPRWMEEAVKWGCMQRAAYKPGVQASMLGQYKTRRDSGDPEDNPLIVYANACRREYERVMSEHAPQDRSGWESN